MRITAQYLLYILKKSQQLLILFYVLYWAQRVFLSLCFHTDSEYNTMRSTTKLDWDRSRGSTYQLSTLRTACHLVAFVDWWREQRRLTKVNENEVDDRCALQEEDLHEMLAAVTVYVAQES